MSSKTIKIQKMMAHAGIASRRACEKLIAAKQVKVNGNVATIGQRIDPNRDVITYQNQTVTTSKFSYYLVNKPRGILTTTNDELGRHNVLSLLPASITQQTRLYPVGRLDKDSEGLLLITNDGEYTYFLTHPKHLITKTYRVLTDRQPTYKALQHLRRGVRLKEGMTNEADVTVLENTSNGSWLNITISEGRHRQVRRMLARVGYETLRLIRTNFGPYSLAELKNQNWLEVKKRSIVE